MSTGTHEPLSRRERHKERTRAALEAAGLDLFLDKGFDQTTVDDITRAVGVSPRTFFRYFPCKEAVLFADHLSRRARLVAALQEAPADEPLLAGFGRILHQLLGEAAHVDVPRHRAQRVLRDHPAVAAFRRRLFDEVEESLVAVAEHRLGTTRESDPRPRLFAGLAMTVVRAAMELEGSADDLSLAVGRTIDALGDVVPQGVARARRAKPPLRAARR